MSSRRGAKKAKKTEVLHKSPVEKEKMARTAPPSGKRYFLAPFGFLLKISRFELA
jgi:hypothetical protein